jgi:pyruvate/2-oxoglutarate dehydrogenase complex dihydrolipoamide dehydrogenase (E3) component/uncharacterized membrane protein YdjX (TVP38/TMEM64 family)
MRSMKGIARQRSQAVVPKRVVAGERREESPRGVSGELELATRPARIGPGQVVRLVLAAAALAAIMFALRTLHAERYLLALVGWIRDAGWPGLLIFGVAYVLATILFLPGSILTLGAGFAYGVVIGTAVVWIAANLGAAVAFLLGRTLARSWVAGRVASSPRFAAIDRAVGREGLKIVLLTRLSPIFPFNLLNYAFGITRVSLRDYVLGSLLGMLPGTVMYVYLGSLITSLSELTSGRPGGGTAQHVFYFVGLAATVGVTVYVTRVARRALAEATQEPAEARERKRSPLPLQSAARVLPDDAHNGRLVSQVHPPRWENPTPGGRYNLVVLGGGTAGLVSAAGAAGLGARVALIEKHLLGGDCLNVGCVPSKAIIAASRVAAAARGAGAFGVRVGAVDVDFPAVMERMRRLRADLAPHDGAARLRDLGVDVFFGDGRFTGPMTVQVDGRRLEFSRAVVATGARAADPPIPGLADVGYLTNETIFSLTELPRRLAVIGAGPIGCEMAQAFRRLGSEVTLFEAGVHVLPREDADAARIVERRLEIEGVRLVRCGNVTRAERCGADVVLHCERGSAHDILACDAVLVGVGRAPNVEGLGLEAAGVAHDHRGVTVDDHLRTTNRRVYAAGDIASRYKFTHTADALARIVLQNALFAGRKRASALHVPWCTYTSPEIAHIGLYEREAHARGLAVQTITVLLREVDRAVLDGEDEGFLRVHLRKGSDQILGATLVADRAGDMISELTALMVGQRGLGTLAVTIHPYPTQAELMKKAADAWNRGRLTPRVRRLFAGWLAVRR